MLADLDLSNYQGLELYAIQRADGMWFRYRAPTPVSYYKWSTPIIDPDRGWERDLKRAKTFKTARAARNSITWLVDAYPSQGVPKLVKFTMSNVEIFDEAARLQKVKEARRKREERREVRQKQQQLQQAAAKLQNAQAELAAAQARLQRLQGT